MQKIDEETDMETDLLAINNVFDCALYTDCAASYTCGYSKEVVSYKCAYTNFS